MKHAKKILALLLALVTLSSFALADGSETPTEPESPAETTTTGTITIDNAVVRQTYTIYRILELESYNTTTGAYAYQANSAWKTWLKSQTDYVTVDAQGYVTWVKGADAAAFAKNAQEYAKTNSISSQGSESATTTTVTFTGLSLGYYLVDSTLGTLCSLDTTNPTVTIREKNVAPTNEKKVKEDSTGNFGNENDADIGQTVEFQSTITAQAGAENYVFHDKMSDGLTFGSVTGITLKSGESTTTVAASNYAVKTATDTDNKPSNNCTFEVVFTQDFCDTLKANDQIVISYTATLNENAVVGLQGNLNESKLSYGNNGSGTSTGTTTPSQTVTYTWDFDVLKYKNGVKTDVLEGVQFVLLHKSSETVPVEGGASTIRDVWKVAKVSNGKISGWEDVEDVENATWPTESILTTNASGKIEIDGLDADTYYLREIKALPGFNKLGADVEVKIEGKKKDAETGNDTYTTLVAEVNNQSGTELPSTGGIGTKIFYIAGAILAVGAAVLLVTKKRVSKTKN